MSNSARLVFLHRRDGCAGRSCVELAVSNAGQFAAIIISADSVHSEARAILALVDAGWRSFQIMADLDEAMRLAAEWSRPEIRRAA